MVSNTRSGRRPTTGARQSPRKKKDKMAATSRGQTSEDRPFSPSEEGALDESITRVSPLSTYTALPYGELDQRGGAESSPEREVQEKPSPDESTDEEVDTDKPNAPRFSFGDADLDDEEQDPTPQKAPAQGKDTRELSELDRELAALKSSFKKGAAPPAEPSCGWGEAYRGKHKTAHSKIFVGEWWTPRDRAVSRKFTKAELSDHTKAPADVKVFSGILNTTDEQRMHPGWLPPYGHILDEAAIYFAEKAVPNVKRRGELWPWSFTTNGEVRTSRVQIGPAVLAVPSIVRKTDRADIFEVTLDNRYALVHQRVAVLGGELKLLTVPTIHLPGKDQEKARRFAKATEKVAWTWGQVLLSGNFDLEEPGRLVIHYATHGHNGEGDGHLIYSSTPNRFTRDMEQNLAPPDVCVSSAMVGWLEETADKLRPHKPAILEGLPSDRDEGKEGAQTSAKRGAEALSDNSGKTKRVKTETARPDTPLTNRPPTTSEKMTIDLTSLPEPRARVQNPLTATASPSFGRGQSLGLVGSDEDYRARDYSADGGEATQHDPMQPSAGVDGGIDINKDTFTGRRLFSQPPRPFPASTSSPGLGIKNLPLDQGLGRPRKSARGAMTPEVMDRKTAARIAEVRALQDKQEADAMIAQTALAGARKARLRTDEPIRGEMRLDERAAQVTRAGVAAAKASLTRKEEEAESTREIRMLNRPPDMRDAAALVNPADDLGTASKVLKEARRYTGPRPTGGWTVPDANNPSHPHILSSPGLESVRRSGFSFHEIVNPSPAQRLYDQAHKEDLKVGDRKRALKNFKAEDPVLGEGEDYMTAGSIRTAVRGALGQMRVLLDEEEVERSRRRILLTQDAIMADIQELKRLDEILHEHYENAVMRRRRFLHLVENNFESRRDQPYIKAMAALGVGLAELEYGKAPAAAKELLVARGLELLKKAPLKTLALTMYDGLVNLQAEPSRRLYSEYTEEELQRTEDRLEHYKVTRPARLAEQKEKVEKAAYELDRALRYYKEALNETSGGPLLETEADITQSAAPPSTTEAVQTPKTGKSSKDIDWANEEF